ncbi:MAG TPA: hypothetical protein VFK89_10460 [Actinomycetota bacterium]|nr:hypothetical protein [Actinomycetota bacterium]
MGFLYLANAVLALGAALSAGATTSARSRYLQGVAVGGIVVAALFFFAPGVGDTWRTTRLSAMDARLVGITTGCAWLVFAAAEARRRDGRWDVAVLVGVAATSVAFIGGSRWSVPWLVLWVPGALAVVLAWSARTARLLIAAGTASITAGLALSASASDSWALPVPADGMKLALVAAGAVAIVVAATLGGDAARGGAGAAMTPIAVGAAFIVLGGPGRAAGPFASLIVVVAALVCGVVDLLRGASTARWIRPWIVGVMTAAALLAFDPYLISRAGATAILGATALELWPESLGRAQIERGALVALLALTAGFNAIASAALISFRHAIDAAVLWRAGPWSAVTALLPATLAMGLVIGSRVARSREEEAYSVAGVIATWTVFVVAVLIGVFPFGARGTSGVTLYAVAAIAGIAATRVLPRPNVVPELVGRVDVDLRPFAPPRAIDRGAGVAAAVVLAAAVLAVLGFAYEGLRVGFL